jgi:dephospho-CoA kinase
VPIIGLTGGIATGKSTVANLFSKRGHHVISADLLVKEIYATDEALTFVGKNWPAAVVNRAIDFKRLRALAFGDSQIRTLLEQFIYARLPERFLAHLPATAPFVIYDVPLLFEKGLDAAVDLVICVAITSELQRQRLIARDHISEELADSILAAQWDIDEKKRLSTIVIENDCSLSELETQLAKKVPFF